MRKSNKRLRVERGGARKRCRRSAEGQCVCVNMAQFGAVGTLLLDAAQDNGRENGQ